MQKLNRYSGFFVFILILGPILGIYISETTGTIWFFSILIGPVLFLLFVLYLGARSYALGNVFNLPRKIEALDYCRAWVKNSDYETLISKNQREPAFHPSFISDKHFKGLIPAIWNGKNVGLYLVERIRHPAYRWRDFNLPLWDDGMVVDLTLFKVISFDEYNKVIAKLKDEVTIKDFATLSVADHKPFSQY